MDITKESGNKETFKRDKLCDSLEKAGASSSVVNTVCLKIEKDIKEGTTTEELFKRASRYLSEENVQVAARYSLRRGIAALGPAGFLFEQYVERILNAYGYTTKRNIFLRGVCVEHEVDVTAHKGKDHFLVEVKYHNRGGIKTDVTVAMYADARLADIVPTQEKKEIGWGTRHNMWLITNTKFTTTAIQYGKCKDIKMTGWSYPRRESLEDLIVRKNLYPVTTLPSVAGGNLAAFAQTGIMLVGDIAEYTPDALARKVGFKRSYAEQIVSEALVCLAGKKSTTSD